MRYALAGLLLFAACSKKPPTAQEKARSGAREALDKAVRTFREMEGIRRQFMTLAERAEGDPDARQQMRELMTKGQQLGGDYKRSLEEAKRTSEAALKARPDDPDTLDIAAVVAFRFGDFDQCSAHLEKLAAAGPNDPRIPARKAMVLRARNRYAEARALLKPVLDQHPDEASALAEDGASAYGLNDFDAAVQRLEAAVKNKAAISGTMAFDAESMLLEARETAGHWKKELEIRAAEATADDLPRVRIETSKGDIDVELFENEAPNTVANFIDLVDKQFYDGTCFHRVLPNFMAQGGDPTSRDPDAKDIGSGGPGYMIKDELPKDRYRRHFRGSLAMAHPQQPDSNGSQFYLTHRPTGHLDGMHTVFGRVLKGQDVVDKLELKDKVIRATVLRKRNHEYRPVVRD